jgi:DNA-binding MarR family transcriptional regulator
MPSANRFTEAELSAWKVNIVSWRLIERSLDQQLQRDAGMPHAYFAILVALNDQSTRSLPLTRVAEQLNYSQSRMSHAVARLEESGWVERLTDPDDRRVTLLHLTGGGRRALATASAGHTAEVRRIFFSALDDQDLEDLRRIGAKLFASLSEEKALPQ